MGFNCVRLVYSLELYIENPLVENSSVSANPQLFGLTGMEVFDKTVESLANAGVMVILNNHISDAKWCCDLTDGNGMWYNNKYSIYEWLTTLVDMT
jgi:endoglucanase